MSTSISQDIVKLLNENDNSDTKRIISKITSEIRKYQEKMKTYIETNYVEFLEDLSSNGEYLEEGEHLIEEVEHCLQAIEAESHSAYDEATKELEGYVDELKEISIGLRVSCKVLQIDDHFQSLEEAKNNKDHLLVMKIMSKLKSLIDDPADKIFSQLACYPTIKIKYHIESDMLLQSLKQAFDRLVQFNEKTFQHTKSVTLKISRNEQQLKDTVLALFNARYNPRKICDFLMENCFIPIIMKPVSILQDDGSSEFIRLSFSYSLKDLGENLRPTYKLVFNNIEKLVQCLGYINVQLPDGSYVLSIFGNQIKQRLLDLIVNECLMNAVPETMDEMKESTLADDVNEFHNNLVTSHLINACDKDLVAFTENIDSLSRNRFCKTIVDAAVEIMRKDLHEMTVIAEHNKSEDDIKKPFKFPCCMVSKSILELVQLLERMIRQSESVSSELSEQLISVIPIIIYRYIAEVPSYHEHFLENIPQQSALLYNNTTFLAHWVTKNSDKKIKNFASLVHGLNGLATDHLNNQIKNQQSLLLGILTDFDISTAASELGLAPIKVVRQCLRQLDVLKNVWQNILPDDVYNKNMGTLINSFYSTLIRNIMAAEDISAKSADQLVEIIDEIVQKTPTFFKDNQHVVYIKTWLKLGQLKMILGASLLQISEQWCEGQGILMAHFQAEEIKHLIRALFQNTDRRANILAKII